jgi:RimJ/RimL family protein N-acetyltransferase
MDSTNNYLFTSERLGYRPVKKSDFAILLELDSDPEVRAFFPAGIMSSKQLEEKIEKYIQFYQSNKFGIFIAIELTTGEIVGRCGFGEAASDEIEVGYVFFKKFWGQGLASEALLALLGWAENNIKVDKIIAYAPVAHEASHRVMEKSGMQYYKNDVALGCSGTVCKFYKKELKR